MVGAEDIKWKRKVCDVLQPKEMCHHRSDNHNQLGNNQRVLDGEREREREE